MLLVWSSLALAHRPHAVVSALVVAPDFQARGTAWLVHTPGDACQLLRTDDFGAHWSPVGGALQADGIVDLAEDSGVLYALAADGTMWTSEDEAATWTSAEPTGLPSTGMAIHSGAFALATSDGVWTGASLDVLSQQLPGVELREVAWSADGAALYAREPAAATIYVSADGSPLVALEPLPDEAIASAIAGIDDTIWVGTHAGVYRWSDAWSTCGALVDDDGAWVGNVTELRATSDGRVFATTGNDAYYVSTDGCARWTFVDTGLEASFGGIGGVSDLDETYVDLVVGDERQIVAGFNGVAWSADAGATWASAPIVASDRVRGLALAPSFPVEPRLSFGTYGGGAVWTDDGGRTWAGSNAGLPGPYNFDLLFDPDYLENRRVWWAGGEPDPPSYSNDGGETWASFDAVDVAVAYGRTTGRIWLFGRTDEEIGVALVREGDAWRTLEGLTEAIGDAAPHVVAELDDGRVLVATDRSAALFLSTDTLSWTELASWDDGFTSGLTVRGDTILHATYASGLHRSTDGGASWTTSIEPVAHPQVLATADDGTSFLAGGDGQIWRSRDDGVSWQAVGTPLPVAPSSIVTTEAFDVTPWVLVGTSRGVYWSQDAGDAWRALPRFQRFAMPGRGVTCTGACATWDQGDGEIAEAWDLTETETLTVSLEGERLRVVADVLSGSPEWRLTVGGVESRPAGTDAWLVEDLGPGWHDVELRVVGGSVRFWAVEALADGEPLPGFAETEDSGDTDTVVTPPAPEDCGCGGSSAWILALALVRRRR